MTITEAVTTALSQNGKSLTEISTEQPVLLTFLRHAGCTFCREALSDLSKLRRQIEAEGTGLAFVTMSPEPRAEKLFAAYGLADVPRFSDPDQQLYRAFELKTGNFNQLAGPGVLTRGFRAALLDRHGFGWLDGNGLRMPGVFLLRDGKVIDAYRHQTAADRPDYVALACPAGK